MNTDCLTGQGFCPDSLSIDGFPDGIGVAYYETKNGGEFPGREGIFGQVSADELGIWSRALTDDEITELFEMGRNGTSIQSLLNGGAGNGSAAVPEPTSTVLLLLTWATVLAARRPRRS